MKTKIYYFTGTGNSLYIAKSIAEKLGDSEVVAIKDVTDESIETEGNIGIVFPVYMWRPPHIVAKFVKKIKKAKYIFAVAVNAGEVGKSFTFINTFLKRNGQTLSAGFEVLSPSNYLPYGDAGTPEKLEKLFSGVNKKISEIVDAVKKESIFFDKELVISLRRVPNNILYSMGYNVIHSMDKNFSVDEKCNGCGICEKICPVKNITMKDGKPTWNHKCEQCYACIHWCPKVAIQYGKTTTDVSRYHHPEINLSEMLK